MSLKVLFITDDRISPEKNNILGHTLKSLKTRVPDAEVQIYDGATTEAGLIKKLNEAPVQLVLAPWHLYQTWMKVEGLFGLNRLNGPVFAGYHGDVLPPQNLVERPERLRGIYLDLARLTENDAVTLIRALATEKSRSGILPLLAQGSSVYFEHWYTGLRMGDRMDTITQLPQVAGTPLANRAASIRMILCALWSLIYEEGPGHMDAHQTAAAQAPKASFQIGADGNCLAIRLVFTMPNWNAKSALHSFMPDKTKPLAAPQILIRYADLVRVHSVGTGADVELTVALFASRASESPADSLRTLWIDPISPQLVTENPHEKVGPHAPHLKPLPVIDSRKIAPPIAPAADPQKDRLLAEALTKLRELKQQLSEKDDRIQELRMGGVGTSPALPPPEAGSLLEAFQQRYFDARYQIRQFEHQINDLEKLNASPQQIEGLRIKMASLASQEDEWIKSLMQVLDTYRKERKKV